MTSKAKLEKALREIATMPLQQDFEKDERGRIKSGSRAWGPGWAAWRFQEIARAALALSSRDRA